MSSNLSASSPPPQGSSIIDAEVEQFSKLAATWWDTKGPFAPLHKFNPTRLDFIRAQAIAHFSRNDTEIAPFSGLSLIDIGCGGGLLSEPMRRIGFEVTAIDASIKNIKTATLHAAQQDLTIDYRALTVEQLLEAEPDKAQSYDVVLCMEVIEHVADPDMFLKNTAKLLKPGGLMVLATLNRTLKAHALAIIGAEYILGWLPKGTHDWNKFLKPSELKGFLTGTGIKALDLYGVSYNPLLDKWALSNDVDVNYMLTLTRPI